MPLAGETPFRGGGGAANSAGSKLAPYRNSSPSAKRSFPEDWHSQTLSLGRRLNEAQPLPRGGYVTHVQKRTIASGAATPSSFDILISSFVRPG